MAEQMSDVLIIFAAWLIGSAVWLLMQIASQFVIVRTHDAYKTTRGMAFAGLIGSPIFVFVVYLALKLWDNDLTWTHVVVMPLLAGWVFAVALLGIHIAARIRGVLKPDSPR